MKWMLECADDRFSSIHRVLLISEHCHYQSLMKAQLSKRKLSFSSFLKTKTIGSITIISTSLSLWSASVAVFLKPNTVKCGVQRMEGNFGIRRIHVFLYKGVKCQNVVGYILEVFSVSQYTENFTTLFEYILYYYSLSCNRKKNKSKRFTFLLSKTLGWQNPPCWQR